jgi:hypothetical protein
MSCHCNGRLDLGSERYLVRGETIHTSIGCFHASLFLGGDGERFILANARDATMAMCPDCSIPVVLGEFPQHFRDHRLPATDAELASWKKGVEDANRLSQRERAAADAARAELAALRPEVLAFARVMSAKIDGHNHDRGEHGWRSATPAHLMGWLESYVTALSYALDASTMDAVLGKAANVANLAMMIADVAGALAAAKEPAPVPTVVTGCQMKDTPETRELVAAAGRMLAAAPVSEEEGSEGRDGHDADVEAIIRDLTSGKPLTCSVCVDDNATCVGAYEDPRDLRFACSGCCGHGNEDGWCVPLRSPAPPPSTGDEASGVCVACGYERDRFVTLSRGVRLCETCARQATASLRSAALRREERDPGTTLVGKVAGGELLNDGTTLVMVQVPGRLPIRMSTPATVILEGALSSPATTEDGHG